MALLKDTLQRQLYDGLYRIFINQSKKVNENEKPEDVIRQISTDMSVVISDAIDDYVKSGDITVGPANIIVTSPTGSCLVNSGAPAKMK